MRKTLDRIHIIGGPGSGKSELASRLYGLTKAPISRLDEIAYFDAAAGSFTNPRDRLSRIKLVNAYSCQPRWIAEGVYFSWLGKSFREAQHIVVLQTPFHLRAENIRQRHDARPAIGEAGQLEYLLSKNREYDLLFESRIAGFLKPFSDKVSVFLGPGKAYKHFKRLLPD